MSFSEQLKKPRTWFIAVPVVILLAVTVGPFVYINFIKEDAPERLSFDDIETTTTVAGDSSTTTAAAGGGTDDGIEGSWEIAAGSEAGYRATEVLFGQSTEGAGRTEAITGTLEIEGTEATTATFEVDMTTLTSDESRRDGQVHSRILETSQFPTATFELTEPVDFGEPADLEEITVQATGDLTVHGVTNSVTIDLVARLNGSTIEVTGNIPVTWADYDISDPSGGPAQVEDSGEIEFALSFAQA